MKVFGSSGTRGRANEELTPAFVLRVAKAAGSAWTTDRVAVARDTRLTGEMLADAAASGLASVGAGVDRLGVVPTPGVQVYAEEQGMPAMVITASHNPPEYNGVKLVGPDGVELGVDALEDIEDRLLADRYDDASWEDVGAVRRIETARERYREQLVAAVDREAIADADLTVAIDPGHGAGALTSPTLFRELGCRVVTVHAQPDGHFPGRDPEPVPENLGDLGRLVRAAGADVGIAHDGDADRAIFFDEHGEYIEGDATLAALAAAELEAGDTTVSAVNVSQRLVDVANEVGADLELTPIGSTNIITTIRRLQQSDEGAGGGEDGGAHVPVAGEGNGGIFFPDYRLCRDGAYTAARFLELIADRPTSEVVAPYGGYHNVRVNIPHDSAVERTAMLGAIEGAIEDAVAEEDAEVTDIDGYRLDYGDAWVLARPSGTEPMIRVYAEAREADRARDLADWMADALVEAKADAA